MNELLSDVRFWFTAMLGALAGFVKYLWSQQAKRLEALEADTVRREEFDQLRADFQQKHTENSERIDGGFARVEALIERNHDEAVQGRHEVKNQILTIVEKVGTIQGRLGLDEFRRGGG